MPFSGNDYLRFRLQQQQQRVPSPLSEGNNSAVHGRSLPSSPLTPTNQNSEAHGLLLHNKINRLKASDNHANPLSRRFNNLTLDEFLDSPGRASLTRLDPNRPPGTLCIFERDFKDPHAYWTMTPQPVITCWFETFAQVYNWDRAINKRVRIEFEAKLKDRMCDQISRWKGKWKLKGDEAMARWLDPEEWAGLGLGISKHRSGQTSYKARAQKHCEKTEETTPDFLVLLDETHRKADRTFIDGKSQEIYKEVSSRIAEEETQLCSGESSESIASGGLSVQAMNMIYTHVAPRKKGRIYVVGSLHLEASSAHTCPPLPRDDPVLLSEKLAVAEACIANQAEKINSFGVYFDYLADKDPEFAAIFRGASSTRTEPTSANPRPEVANLRPEVANLRPEVGNETPIAAVGAGARTEAGT
ncbi:unnamed protein product [Arabidopsis thaliana]|uniref:(thale cress) hypothetical protein n=1 Tax=Arabidopsis thaliana TaxID=3702 RepID=A0A7G2FBG5_ARATH|nr:unnamed protein product [Arabidopsis thaliana]